MGPLIGEVLSVNLAADPRPTGAKETPTGIYKSPVSGPVHVRAPGPKGVGGSGLTGDSIGDRKNHGGDDQAVYAYAREDLDWWEAQLGRELPGGLFGENLTVRGLDLTGALVGERWRVGDRLLLEAACPRIPCAVFAEKMAEPRWTRRFTERGATGAYLRVLEPGPVRGGDRITVEHRPGHQVTLGLYFRALTTAAERLPDLLEAGDALPAETRALIARRTAA
jgi:MOSC domain-containing protein YiiM